MGGTVLLQTLIVLWEKPPCPLRLWPQTLSSKSLSLKAIIFYAHSWRGCWGKHSSRWMRGFSACFLDSFQMHLLLVSLFAQSYSEFSPVYNFQTCLLSLLSDPCFTLLWTPPRSFWSSTSCRCCVPFARDCGPALTWASQRTSPPSS